MKIYYSNGDGTFGAPVTGSAPAAVYRSAAGDFNNDGVSDFAIAGNTGNSVAVYFSSTTTSGGETTTGSGLISVDLTTVEAAQTTLESVRNTLDDLSIDLARIGAGQSRLASAIAFNSSARENTLAAESRIRDVDVADTVAHTTRLQILAESQAALLGQASRIEPGIALSLLESSRGFAPQA